jgi:hypothetical protein
MLIHVSGNVMHQLQVDIICAFCLQGFSTGLPERLQLALLRTLPGLESCAMLRPAYAVEYDYLPAHQCHASLETKKFKGLFFSGQLNGTTGEAAGAALNGKDWQHEAAPTVSWWRSVCYHDPYESSGNSPGSVDGGLVSHSGVHVVVGVQYTAADRL